MKRRSRPLAIFTMSALDVLAMSTGVFVLLLVMMMPYYKKTQQAEATIAGLQASTAAAAAETQSLTSAAAREGADAAALAAAAEKIDRQAAALEAKARADAAAAAKSLAMAVPKPVPPRPAPSPVPAPPGGTPTIDELDLIFVVDSTASMTPAIGQLAAAMRGITRVLGQIVPSLRVGIVAYTDRDTGLDPLTILPPTPTDRFLPRIIAFLERMHASKIGSPTIEEDMYLGLQAAISLPLRPSARQALIVIGDAAAHPEEQEATLALVRNFVARAPNRSVSALFVTTPGAVANGMVDRRFFQDLARASGGPFLDHVGNMMESVLLSVLTG